VINFSVRIVTTLAEFEALAQPWNALLEQARSDNIFLTWEWLYTWTKHYLGERSLRIILVYDARDRLVGIAPFYIRQTSSYGLLRLREMRFLGAEGVASLYLDVIVSKARKRPVLEHIYNHLHGDLNGSWDILTLSEIPAESPTIDFWASLNGDSGKVAEIVDTTASPLITLSNLDDFLQSLSRNGRYNVRRKRRRLERFGQIAYERASSTEDIVKALESFIELHRMRWAQRAPVGTFGSQRFLSFHRDIVSVLGDKDRVRFDFLRLNGEAIAGIYGYSYNGRYFFYLPGFNPTVCPQASPGILLLVHCIEQAIAEGHKEFDLLRGIADYKMAWANSLRRTITLRHYNRHLRSTAASLFARGKNAAKTLVR
jgi:CelD/BcsL family acetyltransferase involved in cellulose biosynthesis